VTAQLPLGPPISRHRTSISFLHVLLQLSIGPAVVIGSIASAIFLERPGLAVGIVGGVLLLAIAILGLLWSGSAFLDLHHDGLVVGRRWPGARRRAMWYSEIHPASVRVFSDIDSLRSPPSRVISGNWHFAGGADLAVTFLGPDRDSLPSRVQARPPAPGRGIVVFGSRDAEHIAGQIRAGLERGGCPPHLARWSAQFGVTPTTAFGLIAQSEIPGMDVDWTP
jgi:hypothetical protein